MARMVQCVKLGRELPGLDAPPFPGDLGQRIYEHVSRQAWNLWPEQEILLINHYGLNLADPQARQLLMDQMEQFYFGPGAQMPPGWSPPGQSAKGAPARKGAPGPRRK
jgi:Fe-S cluster biosynthesis and repair protein YggX